MSEKQSERPERTIDRLARETSTPMWALEIAFELASRGILDEETVAGERVIPDAARVIADLLQQPTASERCGECIECGHTCGTDRSGQCVYQLTVPADSVAVWDDNHCGCKCVYPTTGAVTQSVYVSEHPFNVRCNTCGLEQVMSLQCPREDGQLIPIGAGEGGQRARVYKILNDELLGVLTPREAIGAIQRLVGWRPPAGIDTIELRSGATTIEGKHVHQFKAWTESAKDEVSCRCGAVEKSGVIIECQSREDPPATAAEGEQKAITFTALIEALERLRSKNRNPNREWYNGWNAAIDCLIGDAKAAIAPPAAAPQDEIATAEDGAEREVVFHWGKDADGYPILVPTRVPSTPTPGETVREAASQFCEDWSLPEQAETELVTIFSRHLPLPERRQGKLRLVWESCRCHLSMRLKVAAQAFTADGITRWTQKYQGIGSQRDRGLVY